jgi:protein-S-isoprenylcysteine O-methyltransferase Ste14
MKENRFASRLVELQQDQRLVESGADSIVRPPMYVAFSILLVAAPVVLGSGYSLIPALCIPLLLTFRIISKAIALRTGLAGYDLYRKKVRFRLLPVSC